MKTSYRHLLTVVVLLGIAAVWFGPLVASLVDQRLQLHAAETELSERKAAISDLEHEIDQWDDDAYVKQQARERLLFIEPGDQPYIVIDDRESPDAEDEVEPSVKPESAPSVPSPGPTATATSTSSASNSRTAKSSTTSATQSPTSVGSASSTSPATSTTGVTSSSAPDTPTATSSLPTALSPSQSASVSATTSPGT